LCSGDSPDNGRPMKVLWLVKLLVMKVKGKLEEN